MIFGWWPAFVIDICTWFVRFCITLQIISGFIAAIYWHMAAFSSLIVLSWCLQTLAAPRSNTKRIQTAVFIFFFFFWKKLLTKKGVVHPFMTWRNMIVVRHILLDTELMPSKWSRKCIFATQGNYFSHTFRLYNTIFNVFYYAFFVSHWNVEGISAILSGNVTGNTWYMNINREGNHSRPLK